MPTAALILSLLFFQGPKIAEPVHPSLPGVARDVTKPKMTRIVPLTREQIVAIAAKAMPGKVVSRITTISADRLFEKDAYDVSIYGGVGIDGGNNTITLDAKRKGAEGAAMTVSLFGRFERGEYIVTFEGGTFDKMQMKYESDSGSETIDVPKGRFHIPVVMRVGTGGYFKVTPLITDDNGVYIRFDAIQIARVD